MLRSTLIGVSAAVLATAAWAQEDPATAVQEEPSAATQEDTTAPVEEAVSIIDAKQVATRDEAKLYAESEFLQADQNDDGKVDQAEFIAYASVRAPLPAMTAEQDETATAETETADAGAAETAAAETAEDQFAELSKGDEEISETELVETRVAQFDEADENGDEALDDIERVQFAALTLPKAPKSDF